MNSSWTSLSHVPRRRLRGVWSAKFNRKCSLCAMESNLNRGTMLSVPLVNSLNVNWLSWRRSSARLPSSTLSNVRRLLICRSLSYSNPLTCEGAVSLLASRWKESCQLMVARLINQAPKQALSVIMTLMRLWEEWMQMEMKRYLSLTISPLCYHTSSMEIFKSALPWTNWSAKLSRRNINELAAKSRASISSQTELFQQALLNAESHPTVNLTFSKRIKLSCRIATLKKKSTCN